MRVSRWSPESQPSEARAEADPVLDRAGNPLRIDLRHRNGAFGHDTGREGGIDGGLASFDCALQSETKRRRSLRWGHFIKRERLDKLRPEEADIGEREIARLMIGR